MTIGILGGSFDPPHLGHILIAQQVLEFTDVEHVWLMPCFAHTFAKSLSSVSDRLAMTKLLKIKSASVSTLEIDHKLDGNTINLLPVLKKNYPDDSFAFIIGSDQLPMFTGWGHWEKLLKELSFLVVPRAGYLFKPLYGEMQTLSHPLFVSTNISSTIVRDRVRQGFSVDHLVPEEIVGYIKKHNLYQ